MRIAYGNLSRSLSQDIFWREVKIDGFEEGGEGVARICADLGHDCVRRFRSEQARGRDGIVRLRRLAEFDRHRLVAHERLVFRRKLGKAFLEPAADAAVPADDAVVLVDAQAIVDIAFEIMEHPAEADHRVLRVLAMRPGVENGLGRGHRRGRAAARYLAAFGGEIAAALVFASVVERPAQDAEMLAEVLAALRAPGGIGEVRGSLGEILRVVAEGEPDVDHRQGGEEEGVEGGVEFLLGEVEVLLAAENPREVARVARTVGVPVEIGAGEGLGLAVSPAVVVGVIVGRMAVLC